MDVLTHLGLGVCHLLLARLQPLVCETDHLSIFGGVLNVPEVWVPDFR